MILDDDSICNFINTRIAQTSGFFRNIQSFFTGKDALNSLDEAARGIAEPPDIILVDLNMPVMNGFDFINRIQNMNITDKESVMIVVLTSSEDLRDKQSAQLLGIQHYLQKPLTLKNLQCLVYERRDTCKPLNCHCGSAVSPC
jgi:CheY-like chemotaxis protein